MTRDGLAPGTVNRKLSTLRQVVRVAFRWGVATHELPVRDVKAAPTRDTRGPGNEGFKAMLAALETRPSRYATREAAKVRDRALLRLLFDMALRIAEALELDLAHVDLRRGSLSIKGKGRAGRETLTLPGPTKAALGAWLKARGRRKGPLFTSLSNNRPGSRLTPKSGWLIVRQLGELAGLGAVWPHALRHAAITTALDATNGDVRMVMAYSRHANVRTVMVYDDNRRDQAGDVAARVAGA